LPVLQKCITFAGFLNVHKKMRHFILLFLLTFYATALLAARPTNRKVQLDTVCSCTPNRFQHVIDKFFYQFQTNTDSIYEWAYCNTEGDGNDTEGGKDAIRICYNKALYDPITRTGDLGLDIYVMGIKMFSDRHILTTNNGCSLNATYSGSLLDDAHIKFTLDSISPELVRVRYEFNLVFGKFASMFVSDKVWHNAMRWRLEQVFANLVEYAETGKVIKRKEQ